MKIEGWHIDGFGNFHDEAVSDLPDGLVVVSGPNEAGKSTLAHFLKGMLFGFPDGRSKATRHLPLRGGNLGGSITLVDGTGSTVTLQRGQSPSSLRVIDAGGAALPAGALDALLGSASRELFENVFAVDLRDLVELRALSDEQVRDRIYSAGVLGAGRSARAAIQALEKQRDALLKPNGRADSYRLIELRNRLRAVDAELAVCRRAATELSAQREAEERHQARIAELDEALTAIAARAQLLRNVQALWVPWQAARRAAEEEERAAALPTTLPHDFGHQIDAAARERASAAADLAEAASILEGREAELGALEVDEAAGALAGHADELGTAVGAEEQRRVQITSLVREISDQRASVAEQLAQLAPGLDEEWLAAQPAGIEAAAALRHRASEVAHAAARAAEARVTHERALRDAQDHSSELQALQAAQPHPAAAVEAARARVTGLRRLEAALEEPADRALPPPAVPAAAAVCAGAGGLAALLIGAVGVASASSTLVIVALGLLAASVLAGASIVLRARSLRSAPSTSPDHRRDPARLAAELGFAGVPTLGDLRVLLDAARQREVEATRAAEQVAHARSTCSAAAQELQDAGEQLARSEQSQRAALAAWQAWLAANGLPTQLDARSAEEYLQALTVARRSHQAVVRLGTDLEALQAASAAFAGEVAAHAGDLGIPEVADPVALARQVLARCRAAAEGAAEAAKLQQRVTDAAAEVGRKQRRALTADAALEALLARAGVGTVDEAEGLVADLDAHEARMRIIHDFEQQLATRCGNRAADAEVVLHEADPGSWASRLEACETEREAASAERDQLVGDLRDLQTARRQALDSATIPDLEQQRAGLLHDLHQAAERWRELGMAKALLEATLARYQRERQPAVVQRAERYFEQVTGGRYPHLALDDGTVAAVDKLGRVVDAAALSRGTTDQLYLCLRFALAGAFAEASPLPLLLDDVLVNVDGVRSPQLAQVIAEVAAQHQVFLFTCHHWVVELLTAVQPNLRHVELHSSL